MVEVESVLEKVWKPNKRQQDFIRLPDAFFEGLYGGAAGGGKSELAIMIPLVREFYRRPKFKGIIFRRTYPQLEESLIPRSFDWYPHFNFKYNASKHVWTHRETGATIRFAFMEKDSDARQHDTAEFNYIGWDELTHFSYFQYNYVNHRCRSSDSSLPAFTRGYTNPGNVGHAWVRDRFVKPARGGYKRIYDSKSDTFRIFIPAKLTDNPNLMESDPGYLRRLNLLPEADRRAKLEGDWDAFAGQVFTEFRPERISSEPENAYHVIKPFPIPAWWPKLAAVDWGFRANTYIGWGAVSPDNRLIVYRDYNHKGLTPEQYGSDFARLSQFDGTFDAIWMDPSAWSNRGDVFTHAERFMKAINRPVFKADNDRIEGKNAIHEMLRWQELPPSYIPQEGFDQERSEYINRMYGRTAYLSYIELFQPPKPETNLPKVRIFDSCRPTIEALQTAVYNEESNSRGLKAVEDIKEWDGDDPMDGFRYLCKGVDRYFKGDSELRKRQAEIEVVNELVETGNQTTFYRQMEKLEKKQKNSEPRVIVPTHYRRKGIRKTRRFSGIAH